jgi:hypothetical protein
VNGAVMLKTVMLVMFTMPQERFLKMRKEEVFHDGVSSMEFNVTFGAVVLNLTMSVASLMPYTTVKLALFATYFDLGEVRI